jgi:hypothetical protein
MRGALQMGEESGQEKRAIRRFALQLPVTVTAASGEEVAASAKTKDVSSHGICFYCDSAMEANSEIDFTVTLPSEVTMTEPISVRCHGKVIRVDGNSTGSFQVAAAIETYEFVANDETEKIFQKNKPTA